jgi:sugar phosphate isomerase/epimerase
MSALPVLNRRRFLQTASVASLGLTGWATLRAAPTKEGDGLGGFKLGAQSYTFRNFDLEPALKRIQELGLHYVEFYQKHAPLNSKPEAIKAILGLCAKYDVKPLTYGVQGFTNNHDKNKEIFEFGKALGIQTFSADPDPDSFDSLDKLCDQYKIAIAIHPHGPVGGGRLHRWYSAEIILKAVKDHHPLIGSCLDTGHLIRSEQLGKKLDPAEEIRVMGKRNFGIHLKDHDNKTKTDVIFGKGALDVAAVLKALREVKFDRLLSIEYEANPTDPSPDVKQCVQVFRESVKKLA